MSLYQSMDFTHDVSCLDDNETVKAAQEMTSGYCGALSLVGDQTDMDQSGGMTAAQRVGLKSQIGLAIFESAKEPGMFAFTSDRTGCNLPACYAPWRDLNPGSGMRVFRKDSGICLRATQDVLLAVQTDGFCLACSQSTFSRTGQDLGSLNKIMDAG